MLTCEATGGIEILILLISDTVLLKDG